MSFFHVKVPYANDSVRSMICVDLSHDYHILKLSTHKRSEGTKNTCDLAPMSGRGLTKKRRFTCGYQPKERVVGG